MSKSQEELEADARAALAHLDHAMRHARRCIDAAEGIEPRVVTGWVAVWSTVRYDDAGQQVDGWTYAVGENTDAIRAVGALGIAARALEKQVEGP